MMRVAYLVFLLTLFSFGKVSAQVQLSGSTKQNLYNSNTLVKEARQQCDSLLSGKGVLARFNPESLANAPIKFTAVEQNTGVKILTDAIVTRLNDTNKLLEKIRYLLWERNFSEDCFKIIAMAGGIEAIKRDMIKYQQEVLDRYNVTDPKKAAEEERKNAIQKIVNREVGSDNPQKEAVTQFLAKFSSPQPKPKKFSKTAEEINNCTKGILTTECMMEIGLGNSPEDASRAVAFEIIQESNAQAGSVALEALINGGIVSPDRCIKTISGRAPTPGMRGSDPDCLESRKDPSIVTQEKIKQIINAPYNQAFSPSAQIGSDGGFSNINKRVLEGTLFDGTVGVNFGRKNSGDGSGEDVDDIRGNYEGQINNIDLAIQINTALAEMMASTTSPCAFLPVTTRNQIISAALAKVEKFTLEKNKITADYQKVLDNPNNYSLVTSIAIKFADNLKNKWNRDFLVKEAEEFRTYAQSCIRAQEEQTTTAP